MFALAQITALALAAHTPAAMTAQDRSASFGTQELVEGRDTAAIRAIGADQGQAAMDPAMLINLAIAHARRGDDARARDLFEAAMMHEDRAELETAGGKWMDSRALARKGLAMLDRGAFSSTASIASR